MPRGSSWNDGLEENQLGHIDHRTLRFVDVDKHISGGHDVSSSIERITIKNVKALGSFSWMCPGTSDGIDILIPGACNLISHNEHV
jgi:hypothetical protein